MQIYWVTKHAVYLRQWTVFSKVCRSILLKYTGCSI